MEKKKYYYGPGYFTATFYVAAILFLTSIGLIYSCFLHQSFVYLVVGIVGFIIGLFGLIEVISKKKIFPVNSMHLLREIVALIILVFGVWVLRYGALSHTINWREKMVVIICFILAGHLLHLRGFIKVEEKKN